jgi:hypothetical protein
MAGTYVDKRELHRIVVQISVVHQGEGRKRLAVRRECTATYEA